MQFPYHIFSPTVHTEGGAVAQNASDMHYETASITVGGDEEYRDNPMYTSEEYRTLDNPLYTDDNLHLYETVM